MHRVLQYTTYKGNKLPTTDHADVLENSTDHEIGPVYKFELLGLPVILYIFMFIVVNFDALAQVSDIRMERRQVVFLCWMQGLNLEVSRHLFASRMNAHSQTDWAIEDQAKNLNSTAHPYDEWAFSPLDFTAVWLWLSHLALLSKYTIDPYP